MKYISKIYTAIVGVILILLSARLMLFVSETNKVMEVSIWVLLAGLFGTILLAALGLWLIITAIHKHSKQALEDNKFDYLLWLDKRIAETETEYDNAQTASYGTGLDYDSTAKQRLISKGGKLRAYKEVRDYLRSH